MASKQSEQLVTLYKGFLAALGANPEMPLDEMRALFDHMGDVTAEPGLTFDKKQYTAPAGIVQVNYVDGGGTHTLVFDDPSLSYFELAVPGGPKTGKAELVAGKTYTIYCTIPGHRAAGMQATVTVGAAAPAPAPGASANTPTTAKAGG